MTRASCLVAAALLLGACVTEGPASERGFFSGIAAAVSGQDEANARRLEQDATRREREVLEQRLATQAALDRQAASERDLASMQARWQAMERQLGEQRAALARLRAQRGAQAGPEAQRLQSEIDRVDRDRAQVQRRPGGPSETETREMQQRVDQITQALRRYQGA